jgi:hypothetical protein
MFFLPVILMGAYHCIVTNIRGSYPKPQTDETGIYFLREDIFILHSSVWGLGKTTVWARQHNTYTTRQDKGNRIPRQVKIITRISQDYRKAITRQDSDKTRKDYHKTIIRQSQTVTKQARPGNYKTITR